MKTKIWIALLAIALTSCQTSMDRKLERAEVCISPPETFAYSLNAHQDYIEFQDTSAVRPGQLVATIDGDYNYVEIFGIRIQGDHQEIWFRVRDNRKFLIYDPNSQEWDEVSFGLGDRMQIEELFFLPNGTVFGLPNFADIYETGEVFALSKYNEETKTFEYVKTLREIPASSIMQVLYDAQRGLFWFFNLDDAIYSFDPDTEKIEKHIDILDDEWNIREARISNRGYIYYLSFRGLVYSHINANSGNIRFARFDPDTNLVKQFPSPLLPWPPADHLFVDYSEKVWLGTAGWLEPDGTWYQMFPSPIFLTNIQFSGLDYRWKSPTIELESKDGRIWMKFANGLVWLDPDEEKWCWCSSRSSNIYEDIDGNLWIVADNKLYKIIVDD